MDKDDGGLAFSRTLGRRIVVFEPPKRFTGWMSKRARLMVCSMEGRDQSTAAEGISRRDECARPLALGLSDGSGLLKKRLGRAVPLRFFFWLKRQLEMNQYQSVPSKGRPWLSCESQDTALACVCRNNPNPEIAGSFQALPVNKRASLCNLNRAYSL